MNKMPVKNGPVIEPYCDNWPEIDDTAYIASKAVIMGSVRIGADANIQTASMLHDGCPTGTHEAAG